jgi:hypothetical protein
MLAHLIYYVLDRGRNPVRFVNNDGAEFITKSAYFVFNGKRRAKNNGPAQASSACRCAKYAGRVAGSNVFFFVLGHQLGARRKTQNVLAFANPVQVRGNLCNQVRLTRARWCFNQAWLDRLAHPCKRSVHCLLLVGS